MRIIKPSIEIINATENMLPTLELAGRTCYKSEDRMIEGSAEKFVERMMSSKHESVLEHALITVRFVIDRGISHQIVRHRIASYSQESTRYVNYSKDKFGGEITVIEPIMFKGKPELMDTWRNQCMSAESAYFSLLHQGAKPEEARNVLPTSTKTELIVSMNPRAWRHAIKERVNKSAHPQIREVFVPLLAEFTERWSPLFTNDLSR